MKGNSASTIAGCFALAAFAVAIIAGLAAGNPPHTIMWRALIVLVACYPAGLAVGMVVQHIVDQHIEMHRIENPDTPAEGEMVDGDGPTLDEHGNPTDEEVLVV